MLSPDSGTMASMNTSTPMPPSQWVKLRQNSRHFGRSSTARRMLAPVVVKPDIVSNTASRYDGIAPEAVKGTAPMSEMRIQLSATITKPSRACSSRRRFGRSRIKSPPSRPLPAAVASRVHSSGSP